MARKRKGLPIDGVLLLDKAYGETSNAALMGARWVYQAQKAGHTGTLDPLATGLLPVTLGEATKFSADLLQADKTYVAGVQLGARTTTGDLEGEIVERRAISVTRADIDGALKAFRGEISQVPPMFSALKRDGKTLYDLAREGKTVELAPRTVRIERLNVLNYTDEGLLTIEVTVSKGTYIRVLAEDIGKALGCGAHLASLRRTRVGALKVEEATPLAKLKDIKQNAPEALKNFLLPVDALLQTLPAVHLNEAECVRFTHGQRLPLGLAPAPRVRVYGAEKQLVGTARVTEHGVLAPERLIATTLKED